MRKKKSKMRNQGFGSVKVILGYTLILRILRSAKGFRGVVHIARL
jgi:hypothetical protein